jgi:hypothetical protein
LAINVCTNRYDNSRSGQNPNETQLNPANVSLGTFGKLFARTVDGDLYAQPLIASGLFIHKTKRNVVFLATSRNWVYAYDADVPEEIVPLWSRQLGPPVPRNAILENNLNFASEVGITSTPAIELNGRGGGTLYVVAKNLTFVAGDPVFSYQLHALNLLTGKSRQRPFAQTTIQASLTSPAGRRIVFDPKMQLNRPGLLLLDGVLYLAFGSHADQGTFYGWIMAYEAATLKQLAVYNTAPDWGQGGVWQSGTGLAGDKEGFVYAVVGNGEKPSNHPASPEPITAPLYGNALLKLKLDQRSNAFAIVDWFTASDWRELNENDRDFVGGPILFEASSDSGAKRQLILGGGKDGKFYLADRSNLGGYMAGKNTRILQEEPLCNFHIHGAPIAWKTAEGDIVAFVWSEKDHLKALAFKGMKFDGTPLSKSDYGFPLDELRMPGGILCLSWDGKRSDSAIVWASHPTDDDAMNKTVDGTLRAFAAGDLTRELWNSDMDARGTDRVGSFAKFCPPVVANGKVYLSTFSRELAVYGLFSEIGQQARSDEIGIFELRVIGPGVQQSGFYSCSRYTLQVSGAGIGGVRDSFLFAHVARDSDHETVIAVTARIDGINAAQYPGAACGIMIRKFEEDTDPAIHRFAAILVTAKVGVQFVYRKQDGEAVQQSDAVDINLPCFVSLTATKNGGTAGVVDFRATLSSDGSNWKALADPISIQIDGRLMVGLVATAQSGTAPEPTNSAAQASFSHVAVVPAISDVTPN